MESSSTLSSGINHEKIVQEYLLSHSEESLSNLQRHLTLLLSSDAALKGMSTLKGNKFFNDLCSILVGADSENPLVWDVISILQKACQQGQYLTLGEMFVPVLGRLLHESFTPDKQLRLLNVLQALTWGIEIPWQAPYLKAMLQKVSSSVMSADPQEAYLSLSIIINLLHRNPPARHTFLRCVQVKALLRQLLRADIKTLEFRYEVSKFVMLMGDLSDFHIDPKEVKRFADITFQTVLETVKNENVSLLQHTVNFFEDMIQIEKFKQFLLEYSSYVPAIESILKVLEGNCPSRGCESMLLTLLGHLVSLHPPKIFILLERMVLVSSKIISSRDRSTRPCAVSLLFKVSNKSVLETSPGCQAVNVAFQQVLPVLVDLLTEPIPEKEATVLLKLLCKLTQVTAMKKELMALLDIKVLRAFYNPLLSNGHLSRRELRVENAEFFVQVLVLISAFVQQDSSYLQLFSELSQEKSVLSAIATALKFGTPDTVYEVLKFPSALGFSNGSVAALAQCVYEIGRVAPQSTSKQESAAFLNAPELFGDEEKTRLDKILSRLESSEGDSSRSDLLSVVRYRADAAERELRELSASVEAANSLIVQLRQQIGTSRDEARILERNIMELEINLEQCRVQRDNAVAAQASYEAKASLALKESKEKERQLETQLFEARKTIETKKRKMEDNKTEIDKLTTALQTANQDYHSLQERHKADLLLLLEKEEEIKEKTLQINQLELIKNAINDITSGKKKVEK